MALKAYYKLEGDSTDYSGNSYNGTDSNMSYANFKNKQGGLFNGNTSYFSIGSMGSFGSGGTIAFWFRPNGVNSVYGTFVCRSTTSANASFGTLEIYSYGGIDGRLLWNYRPNSGLTGGQLSDAQVFYDAKDYFVCFAGDGSTSRPIMYINGKVAPSSVFFTDYGNSFFGYGDSWKVATFFRQTTSPPNNIANGKMDNIIFDTSVYNNQFIKTLYQNQRGDF